MKILLVYLFIYLLQTWPSYFFSLFLFLSLLLNFSAWPNNHFSFSYSEYARFLLIHLILLLNNAFFHFLFQYCRFTDLFIHFVPSNLQLSFPLSFLVMGGLRQSRGKDFVHGIFVFLFIHFSRASIRWREACLVSPPSSATFPHGWSPVITTSMGQLRRVASCLDATTSMSQSPTKP